MQSSEGFQDSESTLYNTIMMNITHNTFVQTHKMCNIKSVLKGKLWTGGDQDVFMLVHPW